MNKYHQELLKEIKKSAGKGSKYSGSDNYLGSGHFYYSIKVPEKRKIIRSFAGSHQDITIKDLVNLINSLNSAKSYEEKTIGSLLLDYWPNIKRQLDPKILDQWLNNLVGWAEIDNLCQGIFKDQEILANWEVWEKLIRSFSKSENIAKRRASLVLLTGPVSSSDDQRLADLAVEIMDRLKGEKDILITKAISWLLRSLIKNHKARVEKYVKENRESLPKIAIREAQNKLLKGKK